MGDRVWVVVAGLLRGLVCWWVVLVCGHNAVLRLLFLTPPPPLVLLLRATAGDARW